PRSRRSHALVVWTRLGDRSAVRRYRFVRDDARRYYRHRHERPASLHVLGCPTGHWLTADHFELASLTRASTTPAAVYSLASAATGKPTSRMVALVTGLILTNCTSPAWIRVLPT